MPAVDVIAGPGNIYVALAKQEVAGLVGIESLAALVWDASWHAALVGKYL